MLVVATNFGLKNYNSFCSSELRLKIVVSLRKFTERVNVGDSSRWLDKKVKNFKKLRKQRSQPVLVRSLVVR